MCPDVNKSNGFIISGESASMISDSWEFKVNRCNDQIQKEMGLEKCHSKEETDKWIEDVLV